MKLSGWLLSNASKVSKMSASLKPFSPFSSLGENGGVRDTAFSINAFQSISAGSGGIRAETFCPTIEAGFQHQLQILDVRQLNGFGNGQFCDPLYVGEVSFKQVWQSCNFLLRISLATMSGIASSTSHLDLNWLKRPSND